MARIVRSVHGRRNGVRAGAVVVTAPPPCPYGRGQPDGSGEGGASLRAVSTT